MAIKLYVDDERPCPDGWVLARTYVAAIAHIDGRRVGVISLDHDLGEDKTGYDIVCYIERMVHDDSGYHPPIMRVHSANPVGRANIERVIVAINRRLENEGDE